MKAVLGDGMIPSVLWRCCLGGRKGIQPVKNWVVGCWHGYLSGGRCRLAYAQLMPLPLTVSCSSKIQIGFTFLVLAYPGSPGKRVVKWVCVCLCFWETAHILQPCLIFWIDLSKINQFWWFSVHFIIKKFDLNVNEVANHIFKMHYTTLQNPGHFQQ